MGTWCRAPGAADTGRRAASVPVGALTKLSVLSVLSVLTMLGVSGCSSGGAASDEPRLGADMPAVGACRVLTTSQIAPTSNDTPTVSCTSPHTAVTIAVGGFPASEVTNANLRNGTLGNDALQRCTAAWRNTVGGTVEAQHTTVLGLAYYLPDPDQLSNGARWYRCDLVLGGSDGMALQDLPRDTHGLLNGVVPDSLRACRTAPDFNNGHEVACTSPHVLRAIGTAPLPDQPTYPGTVALRSASAKGCGQVARQWLHGRVGGGTAFQWPDDVSWRLLGDRSATCWAVDTH